MRRVAVLAVVAAGFLGCGRPATPSSVDGDADLGVALDAELLTATWPVSVAGEAQVGRFAEDEGWVSLVVRRDGRRAVEQLGRTGGLAAARAHAEAAALYRQAALASAHALVQTYGQTPQEGDPVGTAHLLTVAYTVTGDLEAARREAAKLAGVDDDPTARWHAPWQRWLAGGSAWPPDLSDLPLTLPAPQPGAWPEVGALPHYRLPERTEAARPVEMGDPGALVALALWHEAVAVAAAGDAADAVLVHGARYRLPVEPPVAPYGPLPLELLFGGDFLHPADAAFVAALVGGAGPAAVEAHAGSSLVAAVARAARAEGRLDPQRALDLVGSLRRELLRRMEAEAGQQHAFHRTFADVGIVGTVRLLALVAEAEGDREASGRLRIDAMERSVDAAADPAGLLSLGAWDAANRYPMRGADILHDLARRYPSLETTRYALDVLAIRVGREQGTQNIGI